VSGDNIYIYVKNKKGSEGYPTTSHFPLRLGFRATRAETQGSRRDSGVGWTVVQTAVCVCGWDIHSGLTVRVGYAVLSCLSYGNDRLG